MGWHGSALTAGSAAGAPVAGFAIDGIAPWAGFAFVGVTGAVLAVIGLALVAIHRRRAAVTRRRVVADSVPVSDARVGAPPVEQKLQVSAQATEPVSFSPGP
jgi:hypothetical protein